MKRMLQVLAGLALILSIGLLPASAPVFAQGGGVEPVEPLVPPPSLPDGEPVDETPGLWFVELDSPPAADGMSIMALAAEQQNFHVQARRVRLQYEQRFAYTLLWNGFSVAVPPSELGKLRRIPGVKAVYPVETLSIPPTSAVSDPDLATALAMTGADIVQSELGFTGEGIKVAVMDTGIDYHHPDLGGCFGEGCRVVTGHDFVGDAFNANPTSPDFNPVPTPDDDPDDCNGHGTHVAGIVGANGEVKGVAPDVTFAAYRVFGCEGSTTSDIMLAAMERALVDGTQVLNMSIGSAFQWPQYPTAQAAGRLVDQGMVVVASIGNSGAAGVYSASAPGVAEKVIGVASFDNTHVTAALVVANPSGREMAYLPLADTTPPPIDEPTPELVYAGQACVLDRLPEDLEGKVALIIRGGCTFNEKYQRAVQNGALGVVVFNNIPGIFAGGGVTDRGVWGISISLEDGVALRDEIAAGEEPVTLTFHDETIAAVLPTGGQISSFSSYGLAPDLSLKPDLGAPGGFIRSTVPLEQGAYQIFSGTSMASPHVAGAAALLLQAHPDTPPEDIRGIFQNSADPRLWWGNPGLNILEPVHRQGAGMLDIDDAILSTTRITPSAIALGESETGDQTVTLTVENLAESDVEYQLFFVNALSTGGLMAPSFWSSDASVTFAEPVVSVEAGETAEVEVTIHPATSPDQGQYGGYLLFVPTGGGQVYRVPFAGFAGDYQSIRVLEPTGNEFPWLARANGLFITRILEDGQAFTMRGGDIPYVLAHFEHQASRMTIEAVDAESGEVWNTIYDEQFTPRNETPAGFFNFPWDGYAEVEGGDIEKAPDGQYFLRMSVLRALGDEDNPDHWETWESPVFAVAWPDSPF